MRKNIGGEKLRFPPAAAPPCGSFPEEASTLSQFSIEVRGVFCTLCASMTTPPRENAPAGSKMRVLFQRLFSTFVLLGLLAGALVWNREAGYYGLVCIFCILTAWEWRHMLIRSGKAGQARLSFLFGTAYPVLLSVACFFNKFRLTMRDEFRMMPDPLLLVVAAPVILAGVRTSVIINIGTATIASTVGASTLGTPIIIGLSGFNTAYVIQGALLVALAAIIADRLFERLVQALSQHAK